MLYFGLCLLSISVIISAKMFCIQYIIHVFVASDWSLLFTGNKHLIKIKINITCYEFNKIFSHIPQHSEEIEQDRKIEG